MSGSNTASMTPSVGSGSKIGTTLPRTSGGSTRSTTKIAMPEAPQLPSSRTDQTKVSQATPVAQSPRLSPGVQSRAVDSPRTNPTPRFKPNSPKSTTGGAAATPRGGSSAAPAVDVGRGAVAAGALNSPQFGQSGNNWNGNGNWNDCNNGNQNWCGNQYNCYDPCGYNWCGPSWYSGCGWGPGWYGGGGWGISFGYSSWSGWNFGIGFSSGWGYPYWGGGYWGGYYSTPYYYAPVYVPTYAVYSPVYVAPVYTPFYEYPATVVIGNYVEQPVVLPPAPEQVYVLPTSQSMAAWSSLNSGDNQRALAAFDAILADNPSDARAQMGRGISAMVAGYTQDATMAFRMALALNGAATRDLPISSALAARMRTQCEALWAEPYADSAFTAAMGYAVINEPALAARVASRAIELGDNTPTTAQLRALVYSTGGGD